MLLKHTDNKWEGENKEKMIKPLPSYLFFLYLIE